MYEVITICPDTDSGDMALRERLLDGWEYICTIKEPMPAYDDERSVYASWTNHVWLRREQLSTTKN